MDNLINLEATIVFSSKGISNPKENVLVLFDERFDHESALDLLNVDEQLYRCSKRERKQRKKAAEKNKFPVGLQKEICLERKLDKQYKWESRRKAMPTIEKEIQAAIQDAIAEELESQYQADFDEGYDMGYNDGYYNYAQLNRPFVSSKWSKGYLVGYKAGAGERFINENFDGEYSESDDQYLDDWDDDYDDYDWDDAYDDEDYDD